MRSIIPDGGSIGSWPAIAGTREKRPVEENVGGEQAAQTPGASDVDRGSHEQTSGPAPDSQGDEDNAGEREDAEELPLDQVFEILKNSRRRQTLHYLRDNGSEASLSDLAEHIAAIENDVSVSAITSSQRKRVYVGLYQCHLPKMDDMDIVAFEKNRGTVELAANADQLDPYLEESKSSDWYRLYSSVTAVGIGLFAVSTLGSAPLGLTPTTVLVALLAVMTLCSGLHMYVEQSADSES